MIGQAVRTLRQELLSLRYDLGPSGADGDSGDGGSAAVQNPTHLYKRPGAFTVSLTVSDGARSATETKQGCSDGTYHPEEEVNHGQMAVYIARAFQLPM
jgi:hypothetical protein